MKKVKSIVFNITNRCNLNCWHCYNQSSISGKYSENKKLYRIAEKISDLNPKSISISGGEPLLIKEAVYEIPSILKKPDNNIALVTNGTMIRSENVNDIMKHYDHLQISVDRTDSESYSKKYKGNAAYGKMLERTISCLSYNCIPINYSHVPNNMNYLIDKYFDKLYYSNVQRLVAQFAIITGRANCNKDCDLSKEQRKEYINNLNIISTKYSVNVKFYIPIEKKDDFLCVDCDGNVFDNSFDGRFLYNILEGKDIL